MPKRRNEKQKKEVDHSVRKFTLRILMRALGQIRFEMSKDKKVIKLYLN